MDVPQRSTRDTVVWVQRTLNKNGSLEYEAYLSGSQKTEKKTLKRSDEWKKGRVSGTLLPRLQQDEENTSDPMFTHFPATYPLSMEEEMGENLRTSQWWRKLVWRLRTTLGVLLLLLREWCYCVAQSICPSFTRLRTRSYGNASLERRRTMKGFCKGKLCGQSRSLWCYIPLICLFVCFLLGCAACHRNASFYLFAPDGEYFFTSSYSFGNLQGTEKFTLSQVQFVSCNQHNLPQSYWSTLASAAMSELQEASMQLDHNEVEPNLMPSSHKSKLSIQRMGSGSLEGAAALASCQRNCRVNIPHANNSTEGSHQDCDPPPLDAFIWLGDIIYADKPIREMPPPSSSEVPTGMVYPFETVREMWRTQWKAPEYTAFRETCVTQTPLSSSFIPLPNKNSEKVSSSFVEVGSRLDPSRFPAVPSTAASGTPTNMVDGAPAEGNKSTRPAVWGVWDDHDMGVNDGGKEFLWKNISREFLFEFLEVPPTDPRRQREEGVFTFHTVDTSTQRWLPSSFPISESRPINVWLPSLMTEALSLLYENLFCTILLDVRSFRDPANVTESGDMLGEAQWKWFEKVLRENVSSLYTPSEKEGNTHSRSAFQKEKCATVLIGSGVQMFLDEKVTEHWGSFPRSRDRLLQLLRQYRIERVVFLTGDVHMGELGADFSSSTVYSLLGYPVVEGTSSGLTHSADFTFIRPTKKGSRYFSLLHPMRWVVPTLFPSPRRTGLYVGTNFGSVKLETMIPSNVFSGKNGTTDNQAELLSFKEKLRTLIDLVKNASDTASHSSFIRVMNDEEQELGMRFSEMQERGNAVTTPQTTLAKYKRDLQTIVEGAINVTLTIFSLDLHNPSHTGEDTARVHSELPPAVNRLSFPLEMLTYAEGGCYVNSIVEPRTGWVNRDSGSFSLCDTNFGESEFCCRRLNASSLSEALEHYESTVPLPFFTRFVRMVQALIYPWERMLFVGYIARNRIRRELSSMLRSLTFLGLFFLVYLFVYVWMKIRRYSQSYSRVSELENYRV